MKVIHVATGMTFIPLGRKGENLRTQIVFPVQDWLDEYPGASIGLINRRPGESDEYPVVISAVEDGTVKWTVGASELAIDGNGNCELIAIDDGVVAKSKKWDTVIFDAMTGEGDAPDPWESWVQYFEELKDEAVAAVDEAMTIVDGLEERIEVLEPEATSEDIGKVLKVKAVENGKATEYEFGVLGTDIIDDTAGAGDTDVTWSADKLTTQFSDVLRQSNASGPTSIQNSDGDVVNVGYLWGNLKAAVPYKRIEIGTGSGLDDFDFIKQIDGANKRVHFLYNTGVMSVSCGTIGTSTEGQISVGTILATRNPPGDPEFQPVVNIRQLFSVASTAETQAIITEYAG